jgi:hypothetical protein
MRIQTRCMAMTLSGCLLAIGLSSCGGDDPAPAEPAADETRAESPSETEPEAEPGAASVSGDVEPFLGRLKAGLGDEGSVHVEMTMTGPLEMSAEGDTSYGPDGNEMQLTMAMSALPGGELEMVVVDDQAFMSMPGVGQPGQFFEIDESSPAFGSLDNGLSPADSFAAFDAGLESVEEVGDDEIGGEPTTRYTLEVDAAAALEATGQASVPGLPDSLVYDVWLDSDDRMRHLTYELVGTELTMDMTDWGKDAAIGAPAEKDLIDAPPGV